MLINKNAKRCFATANANFRTVGRGDLDTPLLSERGGRRSLRCGVKKRCGCIDNSLSRNIFYIYLTLEAVLFYNVLTIDYFD